MDNGSGNIDIARQIARRGFYDGERLHRFSLEKQPTGEWALFPAAQNPGGRFPIDLFEYVTTGEGKPIQVHYIPDSRELSDIGGDADTDLIRIRGPVRQLRDVYTLLDLLKHEIAHILHRDPNRRDLAANDFHRFFTEWRANLWTLNGDVDRALHVTLRTYPHAADKVMKLFPPTISNERLYRALSIYESQLREKLKNPHQHRDLNHQLQLILDGIPSPEDEPPSEASVIVAVEEMLRSWIMEENSLATPCIILLALASGNKQDDPYMHSYFANENYQSSIRRLNP